MPPDPNNISLEPLFNRHIAPIEGYMATDQSFDGTNTTYFGFVDKDENWYILEQVVAGDDIAWRYAKGSGGYTTAWAARNTTVSYDYAYTVF